MHYYSFSELKPLIIKPDRELNLLKFSVVTSFFAFLLLLFVCLLFIQSTVDFMVVCR